MDELDLPACDRCRVPLTEQEDELPQWCFDMDDSDADDATTVRLALMPLDEKLCERSSAEAALDAAQA